MNLTPHPPSSVCAHIFMQKSYYGKLRRCCCQPRRRQLVNKCCFVCERVLQVFKAELEGVLGQLNKGNEHTHTSSAINISHISGSVHVCTAGHGGVCVVNDLFATDRCGYSRLERQARCKLASLYRLLHLYNWTSLTHCYSTVRASRESEHILLLPVGLCFAEATAANLMKVDMLGSVLDGGSSGLASLCSSFSLHAHVYCCRPDIRCVIHTHTPAVAAVSSMKCGILPISHEAFLLGKVAYFSLTGSDVEERAELQAALGTTAKVVVLRGHGVLALGESLEEAFHYIYHCQLACDIQVKALSCAGGMDKLFLLDAEKNPPKREDAQMEWRTGEAEFESLMRLLDNLGYRTGYPYRHPVVKEALRHRNEVEIPATVTTTGLEEEDVFVWRPVNFLLERQQRERARWLNSPNCYLKVNVPENSANGETSPRTRTVWKKTAEIGSGGGTPIKIEDPNQFVPLNTNPTEVLVKRNQIRDQHWVDMMTAGPRSQLLAGIEVDKKPGPVSLSLLMYLIIKLIYIIIYVYNSWLCLSASYNIYLRKLFKRTKILWSCFSFKIHYYNCESFYICC
uniref:Class II aldolase/adducin N-terminal domain-containing protein n=1 Tax=Denticeps clupeoides TaxID=299321 RepID=A0AAY4DQB6_9TELE